MTTFWVIFDPFLDINLLISGRIQYKMVKKAVQKKRGKKVTLFWHFFALFWHFFVIFGVPRFCSFSHQKNMSINDAEKTVMKKKGLFWGSQKKWQKWPIFVTLPLFGPLYFDTFEAVNENGSKKGSKNDPFYHFLDPFLDHFLDIHLLISGRIL